jgi:para-aminobenzoate synthetase component 1
VNDDAVAIVGGRTATGVIDVTSDLGALDSTGVWAVVMTYEGKVTCARFRDVRTGVAPAADGPQWRGPRRETWTSSLDKSAYIERVHRIREQIADGEVYQVNLCRVLSAPLPGRPDLRGLGAALARGNPAPYAATVHLPAQGVSVACASPERFLHRAGDVVTSDPIKGTARTADAMLPKDFAENVMIVDLVRNDLSRVAVTGSVTVPRLCELEEHPGLVHLVSRVEARLRPGVGWADLLAVTFPPGSVTGAPKSSAVRLISELEPAPRDVYCGAVGWVDADARTGVLGLAIRTFWTEGETVHLGTGAGITWGSDPEAEWAETELKAARLLAVAASRPPHEIARLAPDSAGTPE